MTFLNPETPPAANGIPTLLHGRDGEAKGMAKRVFEQPWHRTAAYMLASGMPRKKVATALDKDVVTIHHLVRNGWFQELLTEISKEAGLDVVESLIKGETLNCVNSLVEIRDAKETPASTKADVNKYILDRVYGKPTQKVEQKLEVTSDDPVAEAERLEAENRRLMGLSSPS